MQLVRDRYRCGTGSVPSATGIKPRRLGAFSLLLAACCDCEGRAAELSAAFAFASAAAAKAAGPRLRASLPPDLGDPASYGGGAEADLDKTADGLASLAGVLAARMSAAARLNGPAMDVTTRTEIGTRSATG